MNALLSQVEETVLREFPEALTRAEWAGDNPAQAAINLSNETDEVEFLRLAQAFRQVLLTRVPGWAVTSMKMEYAEKEGEIPRWKGLPQKYGRLPGVVENVREIARNLQAGVFRLPGDEAEFPVDAEFSFDGAVTPGCREILLGDWFEDGEADRVFNPEHAVFTLQDTVARVWVQFLIEKGIGYRSAPDIARMPRITEQKGSSGESLEKTRALPRLHLDADFNPVKKVGFRVDEEEKEERLVYTIETRPNRTPKEAFEIALASFAIDLQGESTT